MKTCSKCGEDKDLSAFHKAVKNKDGLRPDCKDCRKIETQNNLAASNQRRNERYANDPEYRKRINERHKKHNSKANARAKKHIATFSDTYVIAALKRGTSLKTADIKAFPLLIEAQRENMKLNRIFRNGIKTEHRNPEK